MPTEEQRDQLVGMARTWDRLAQNQDGAAETVPPMKDGLPKLRDFPAEAGGSGEVMPE
jgi:hypothetical protein